MREKERVETAACRHAAMRAIDRAKLITCLGVWSELVDLKGSAAHTIGAPANFHFLPKSETFHTSRVRQVIIVHSRNNK